MALTRPSNIAFFILLVYVKRAALLCPMGVAGVAGVAGVIVTLLRLVWKVGEGVKNVNRQEGVS